MDELTAVRQRHSVRKYQPISLKEEHSKAMREFLAQINAENDLNFQLIENEPKAFDCMMAHYGRFSGVTNYIALVGKKCKDFDQKIGYWGEKAVLFAQTLGLNTCWVALTYKRVKNAYKVNKGEKFSMVISIGYGINQGVPHKGKSIDKVCNPLNAPDWFIRGVECALLAPTAINQQAFYFNRTDNEVQIKDKLGPCSKCDLGIVKYHFELGAGKENFVWKK